MFIGEQIRHHANHSADKTAIIYQDKPITYKQLMDKLAAYRLLLASEAVRENWTDPLVVAIDLKRQDEQLYWFLAVTSLGWNGMLCHSSWDSSERDAMAERAQAVVFLTDRSEKEKSALPVWNVFTLSPLKQDIRLPQAAGSALFYTGFTSGSTGVPKAFTRTHQSWTESFADVVDVFKLKSSDCVSVPGQLVHSLFLFAAVHTLHLGATVCLEQQFEAKQTSKSLSRHGINVLYGVPTMVYALAQEGNASSKLDKIIVSGAKWQQENRAQVKRVFAEAQLFEFYGASELSFVSYINHSLVDEQQAGVGKLFPSVRVHVEEDGELFVRSPFLFAGYVGEEPIGPSFSVGDLGRIDDANSLHVTGRKGNMLIIGGHNVYPEETEEVVKELAFVEEAVAVGVPDTYWGSRMALYVQASEVPANAISLIRSKVKEALPPLKRPRKVYLVEQLPLLPSGKVDRQGLVGTANE
ncbi:long-chain acyl-CoA synthetase [Alkalihalobacillus xiaoxiensis]|uniref:Long-chain acyl-CoA synthetase n=1 Tax=Shouchella xiaoxiensis TaxID=766895 RepID=A0ABS2SYR8_9BACI|nr:AMP-binding protein [Shouchella xiaoxiensis]MBM7840673.1 long-chain acyl-CoA synthetase [Shouchella xiaoxiensis]